MRITLIAFLILASFCSSVEARTWRPTGRPAVSGDFAGILGDNVQIKTSMGIETIPYLKLSTTDRAVVKSSLQSSGNTIEAIRLNDLETGRSSGSGSEPSMADLMPGEDNPNERVWTDINGNQITGEFVAVVGPTVQIRVKGRVQAFPVAGFSPVDQQWLAQQAPNGAAGSTGGNPEGMPGMPMPGKPTQPTMPMQPGQMPPGYPGSMPGSTMPPSSMPPSDPGFSPGMGRPGSMMPPGSTMPPGGTGFPGMDNSSGSSSSLPGYNPGSGGPEAFQGAGAPPNMLPPPSASYTPPEMPRMPGFSRFEDVLKCDDCGAEFTEADGLKEGDACPKCSGGSSSGGTHFRSTRGVFRGIAAIIALAVGAIGWIAKKVMGSN